MKWRIEDELTVSKPYSILLLKHKYNIKLKQHIALYEGRMSTTSKYHAILPILNNGFTTYRGQHWWMTEDLRVGTISEVEARLISKAAPTGFLHTVDLGQKSLHLSGLPLGRYDNVKLQHETIIRITALAAQTTSNIVADQLEYDEARTAYLNELGYIVIRFTNREVFNQYEAVVQKIADECQRRIDTAVTASPHTE